MQRLSGRRAFSSDPRFEENGFAVQRKESRTPYSRYTSRMALENAQFSLDTDTFNSYAPEGQPDATQVASRKAEAEKRLTKIRTATLATRHFGTMQSATSRQMYRPNTRGTRQSFVNMFRNHYERKCGKPITPIMPWSTDSGMRNLPDRIFSHADRQRDEINRLSSSKEVTIAPPAASKTIAKEDVDAGLLEAYTLPGSSGYAQTDDYGSDDWVERNAPNSIDSDPYMVPGAAMDEYKE